MPAGVGTVGTRCLWDLNPPAGFQGNGTVSVKVIKTQKWAESADCKNLKNTILYTYKK